MMVIPFPDVFNLTVKINGGPKLKKKYIYTFNKVLLIKSIITIDSLYTKLIITFEGVLKSGQILFRVPLGPQKSEALIK